MWLRRSRRRCMRVSRGSSTSRILHKGTASAVPLVRGPGYRRTFNATEVLEMGYTETSVGLRLSELAPGVVQSEIRAMTQECDRMGGVNLAQGVCDTEVPEVVAEGAIRAIRDGLNIYTRMDGIERLRRSIAGKVERTLGITADPEREVFITNGVTGAFQAGVMA